MPQSDTYRGFGENPCKKRLNIEYPFPLNKMKEGIQIADNEIPEAIRGPWKSMTILRNGTPLDLGGHSDRVTDFIEAAIVRSGAGTKQDVLKVLDQLAAEVVQGRSVQPE